MIHYKNDILTKESFIIKISLYIIKSQLTRIWENFRFLQIKQLERGMTLRMYWLYSLSKKWRILRATIFALFMTCIQIP